MFLPAAFWNFSARVCQSPPGVHLVLLLAKVAPSTSKALPILRQRQKRTDSRQKNSHGRSDLQFSMFGTGYVESHLQTRRCRTKQRQFEGTSTTTCSFLMDCPTISRFCRLGCQSTNVLLHITTEERIKLCKLIIRVRLLNVRAPLTGDQKQESAHSAHHIYWEKIVENGIEK